MNPDVVLMLSTEKEKKILVNLNCLNLSANAEHVFDKISIPVYTNYTFADKI